ncbi:MAG: MOSC domain-containing protein [Woeseiaceae bacterium]
MKLERLVRYPVKGLGPDELDRAVVSAGGAIPFDREYAVAHGVTEFDPAQPKFLDKRNFLVLMQNASLAALKPVYAEAERRVTVTFPDGCEVSACLDVPQDRRRLEARLDDFIGGESRGGAPRVVSAKDHRFFDVPQNYLSLINLASVEDLGRTLGTELDPIRFRANLYVSGLPAWQETALVGRGLSCGDLHLHVVRPISRCAATSVNPQTAEIDVNVPFGLRKHYDTLNMGLYVEVTVGGQLERGGTVTLDPV